MGGDSGAKASPCTPPWRGETPTAFFRPEKNTGGDTPARFVGTSLGRCRALKTVLRAVRLTFLSARTTTPLGVDFLFSARIVD